MKIFVTGADGYVGSILCPYLKQCDHEVVKFDIGMFRLGEDTIRGDIREWNPLSSAMRGCDAVIHLAALANDPSAELNSQLTYQVNHLGSINVVEAAIENGVKRFVQASSSSVYGCSDDNLVTETSPTNPLSIYAKYKLETERILLSDYSRDINICILRKATIFGSSPRMRFDLYINLFSLWALRHNIIVINGGDQWRPNIHISDVARIYEVMCRPDLPSGTILNVANINASHKISDIGAIFRNMYPGLDISTSPVNDARSYRISVSTLYAHLPPETLPRITIGQGIKEIDGWIRSNNITVSKSEESQYRNLKKTKEFYDAEI